MANLYCPSGLILDLRRETDSKGRLEVLRDPLVNALCEWGATKE